MIVAVFDIVFVSPLTCVKLLLCTFIINNGLECFFRNLTPYTANSQRWPHARARWFQFW